VLSIDIDAHIDALTLAERYRCTIFDALVLATALRADCGVLWSEEMQNGLLVNRRPRIINPFR
jgi:predicted nucleic acid-binding protein